MNPVATVMTEPGGRGFSHGQPVGAASQWSNAKSDAITLLESKGPVLAKTWLADGTLQSYDKARFFKVSAEEVQGLFDLHELLKRIEPQRCVGLIRGAYIGDQAAQSAAIEQGDELPEGYILRRGTYFTDQALHWLMIDVDNYRPSGADPVREPEQAALEFIKAKLPEAFHDVSFCWSLSAGAGHAKNEGLLKMHLHFWLQQPRTSTELRAWAETIEAGVVDQSLFNPVQLHYTAAPLFEEGVIDPVPVRLGLFISSDWKNEVELSLPAELTLRARQRLAVVRQPLADPHAKPGLIGAFCRAFGPEQLHVLLPEAFKPSRRRPLHFDWQGHGAEGVFVTECGRGLVNVHNTAPKGTGSPCNIYDFVRLHLFAGADLGVPEGTRPGDMPSCRQMRDWIKEHHPDVFSEASRQMITPEDDFGMLGNYDGNAEQAVANLSPSKKVGATVATLATILRDPTKCNWQIGFDQFEADIKLAPAGEDPPQWQTLTDSHYTKLREHIERSNRVLAPKELMRDTVELVAEENSFDSAQQWLNGLSWDGVPRMENFLSAYCGAADTEYHRAVSKYLWSALAGRVLSPGCKADMLAVFAGGQGCGKTSTIEAIAFEARFFGTIDLSTRDDDTARKMRGKLVLELPELRGLGARDSESLKAFLSATSDCWVEKYKERPKTNPRRGIFIASTNQADFLRDSTGNRRWLPVKVGQCDPAATRRDCAQLWAEARVYFLAHGVEFRDAERLAREHHEDYSIDDPWAAPIQAYVDELLFAEPAGPSNEYGGPKPATYKRDFVTTDELIGCLSIRDDGPFGRVNGIDMSRRTPQVSRRVAEIIERLGWVAARRRVGGHQKRGYERQKHDHESLAQAGLEHYQQQIDSAPFA